jgi:hypothetical protein
MNKKHFFLTVFLFAAAGLRDVITLRVTNGAVTA